MPASTQEGRAAFTIAVPYVSGAHGTQSVVVSLLQVNGASPQAAPAPVRMNLAQTDPECTLANQTLTCVATITVPAGKDAFSVATYDAPNGIGSQVSVSYATAQILSGAKTSCTKKSSGGSSSAPLSAMSPKARI